MMMYVLLVAFFVLMGKMIADESRSQSEQQATRDFLHSEYHMM